MKIAVVGAGGFIGSALVRHLARDEHAVAAFDLRAPRSQTPGVSFQPVDLLTSPLSLASSPDVVFYLAQSPAYQDFPNRGDELFGVNTFGAIKACNAAREAGARLFVYASTGNVYRPSFTPLREDGRVRRDEAYPASKVLAEEALALFRPHLAVTVVRPFGVFGPGQTAMLPVALRQKIDRGEVITLERSPSNPEDDGGLRMSFCYVKDAVYCLSRLAALGGEGRELPPVLNLAGPTPFSIREFAWAIARALGREPRFELVNRVRGWDLIADVSLLRATLDPAFTPLPQAISEWLGVVE